MRGMLYSTPILKWHRYPWNRTRYLRTKKATSWTAESTTTAKLSFLQRQKVGPSAWVQMRMAPPPGSTAAMATAAAME
jgi:hypothetical protein